MPASPAINATTHAGVTALTPLEKSQLIPAGPLQKRAA
jgi:hypothetical protein